MYLILSLLLGVMATPELQEEATYAIMYFYTPDCPACQEVEPFINYLREEYSVRIYAYNMRNPVGLQYGLQHHVRYVPLLIIQFERGDEKELKRYEGVEKIIEAELEIAEISKKIESDEQD